MCIYTVEKIDSVQIKALQKIMTRLHLIKNIQQISVKECLSQRFPIKTRLQTFSFLIESELSLQMKNNRFIKTHKYMVNKMVGLCIVCTRETGGSFKGNQAIYSCHLLHVSLLFVLSCFSFQYAAVPIKLFNALNLKCPNQMKKSKSRLTQRELIKIQKGFIIMNQIK